jgi:Family of unknown function (DUF6069)
MTNGQSRPATQNSLPVSTYLLSGLIAGAISAVIANLYYLIFSAITGYSYVELNVISITLASVIPSLLGSLVYFGLSRQISTATNVFVTLGLIFGFLSIIPTLVAPPNPAPGFAVATAPLHILVAVVCVTVVPFFARRRA